MISMFNLSPRGPLGPWLWLTQCAVAGSVPSTEYKWIPKTGQLWLQDYRQPIATDSALAAFGGHRLRGLGNR